MSSGTTDLTIAASDGRGKATTWHLTCQPPGGDHPNPAAACAALEAGGAHYLPEVSKDLACTEIYGAPETARVTGTWRGGPVSATLSRTDGCQIARWNGPAGLLHVGGL